MTSVQQAIQKAKEFALAVLELPLQNLLVEGVGSDDHDWHITLGFDARRPKTKSALVEAVRTVAPREFKTFQVDKNTGEVRAMQMQSVIE